MRPPVDQPGLRVARQRIRELPLISPDPAVAERAAALLVDLWAAFEAHGVTEDVLRTVTVLPGLAMDAITAADRQARIRGWSS